MTALNVQCVSLQK